MPSCPPGYFDARNPDMNKCISECGQGWRRAPETPDTGGGSLNYGWPARGVEGTLRKGDGTSDSSIWLLARHLPPISHPHFQLSVSVSELHLPPNQHPPTSPQVTVSHHPRHTPESQPLVCAIRIHPVTDRACSLSFLASLSLSDPGCHHLSPGLVQSPVDLSSSPRLVPFDPSTPQPERCF